MAPLVTISKHTTTSSPSPHILYTVQLTENGKHTAIDRRYSEFVDLHNALKDTYELPPKRILTTTFVPSAWVDDKLIAERKAGLASYLSQVVSHPKYRDDPATRDFLSPTGGKSAKSAKKSNTLEDALPSTLSRKDALKMQAEELRQEDVNATTPIAASYYPDWSASTVPPEGLDYTRWNILYFAFTTPNSSSGLSWDSGSQSILQRLVSSARSSGAGTKICLSVGGWGGSYYFSNTMSSSSNRSTFVNALVSAVNTYGLDGIDIDWEYPNSPGAGNPYSASDSANFLTFLQSLRSSLGSSKIISAAVTDLPWLGSNGNPLTNVSAYFTPLTYVNIMNYDVWGASSTPGPNAPYGNLCGTSQQPQYSAEAAFSQWTAAGAPASKLVLGLPLYGYVSQSSKTALTGSFVDPKTLPTVDAGDVDSEFRSSNLNLGHNPNAHPRSITAKPQNADGKLKIDAAETNLQSWYGQQIPFSSLVSSGALVRSNGAYVGGGGFTEGWDNCSDTPFLFNTSQTTVVTYDDTYSLGDKAAYAKSQGMAGCFTWSLDQDDGVALQNVIRSKLGKS